VNLDQGNLPENILNKVGYAEKNYNRKFVKSDKLKKLFNAIIEYSENHGHPFASIRLDSIKLRGESLSGSIHYEAGPLIRFESLNITGTNSVKKSFLEKYLGVQPGFIYEEKKLKSIPGKLNSLIFITLKNQVHQTFQNDQSSIYLEIVDRPVNKVDGIIGILPNEGSDKKVLVTGQLDLSLNNLFNSGKRLNIEWQRVRKESQFLNMDYLHPNLLNTNLNFNTSLNLLKEDTSYFNITARFGLSYLFGSGFEVQLFSKIKSGRLSSTDQFLVQNALPPFSDFDINLFGVRVDFRKDRKSVV
jgi:outer membrane protein assembly factor BamA